MAKTIKAYKNLPFLNSRQARPIRILCEYEEPRQRFLDERVRDTIVFFGSARSTDGETARATLETARENLAAATDAERATAETALRKAEKGILLSRYYDMGRSLAARLTRWDLDTHEAGGRYIVCTGGGPGMMEAANRGAADIPGGRSVGLGISLPFEEKVNRYVPEELAFEFHYFFMRKYWFLYLAKGMVVLPGGFGTLDELFEMTTLRQTGKIKKPMPTVLLGGEFWRRIINFDALIEWGTISPADVELFHICDTEDEAFEYLTAALETQR